MKYLTNMTRVCLLVLLAGFAYGQLDPIKDYEWIGISMGSTSNGELPSPLALVMDAYMQAKSGNRSAFYDRFEAIIQKDGFGEVDNLFTIWSHSTDIVYTLAVEARLAGGAQRRAFLILPKAINPIQDPSSSGLKPLVLYAIDRGAGWKLTTSNLHPEATSGLLTMATSHRTEMHPSDEEIQRKLDDFDRQYIAMLEQKGVPQQLIIAEKEVQEQMNRREMIATWDDWQRFYHATYLTNQPAFSSLEPVAMDFSTPYAAWRSLLHAQATGQINVLLAHADEGSRTRMTSDPWYAQANAGKSRLTFSHLTWEVPLLKARATVEEKEYVLFWSRSQDPQKGREGLVSFNLMVLCRKGDQYVLTDDMSSSDFCSLHFFAGPDDSLQTIPPFGLYETWRENWANSKFPPYFYTIEAPNISPKGSD